LGEVEQVNDDSAKDDKACDSMDFVMLQADAAASNQHVQWNKKLEQGDEQPNWNHVSRPEKEESVKHVEHSETEEVSFEEDLCG
jgi:hypothetical protein